MAARPQQSGGSLAALAESPLLARLDDGERERLVASLELREIPAKTRIHGDGDAGKHLYIVLAGTATLRRAELALRRLGPGDSFGELALLGGRHRGEIVTSEGPLSVACLSVDSWADLDRREPRLAAKLAIGVAAALAEELANLTGDMGLLLRGRSLPRAQEIAVRISGQERRVRTGTRLIDLLPAEVDGAVVVAGLLGQKPVSLSTAITAEASIAPLTVNHWEGRQIYAHSLGLLLLEAAHQVAPSLRVRHGAVARDAPGGGRAGRRAGRPRRARRAHLRGDEEARRARRTHPARVLGDGRGAEVVPRARLGRRRPPAADPAAGDGPARLLRRGLRPLDGPPPPLDRTAARLPPRRARRGARARAREPGPPQRRPRPRAAPRTRAPRRGHARGAPALARRDGRDERRRVQRALHLRAGLAAHPRRGGVPREADRPHRRRDRRRPRPDPDHLDRRARRPPGRPPSSSGSTSSCRSTA